MTSSQAHVRQPHALHLLLNKIALAPLLVLQGQHVRRTIPQLPEPQGERSGIAGAGHAGQQCRILIVGDSSGAGVGVRHQDHAFASQAAAALSVKLGRPVRWQLVAETGRSTQSIRALLAEAKLEPADVVVLCLGANDVLEQTSPKRFLKSYGELVRDLPAQVGASLAIVNGLPPMHMLSAAPQPLRWYLGLRARRLDAELRRIAAAREGCEFVSLQWAANVADLASDGFHPGPGQYRAWAAVVANRIAQRIAAR
jgi:lysophospholipase L1-like esterase